MARVLARREVGRHYDDEFRNVVIVEEVDTVARWNWSDDRKITTRVEKRVPLTAGERLYLLERTDSDDEGQTVEWMQEATRLADENAQLRAWLTSMFFYIADRQELLDLCRDEINRRWPE